MTQSCIILAKNIILAIILAVLFWLKKLYYFG